MLVHATCIAIDGRAALLMGPSGSGKSDLALRLCTGALRNDGQMLDVRLVADDQVELSCRDGRLFASSPPTIAGRIEVRGIGILALPYSGSAEVKLVVKLVHGRLIERLPDPSKRLELLGVRLPTLSLPPFEASAPAKIALALLQLPSIEGVEGLRSLQGD